MEHNFILQIAIDQADVKKTNLCIAWLGIANAFGSVPHSSLLGELEKPGLSTEHLELAKDLYSGSTTTISTAEPREQHLPSPFKLASGNDARGVQSYSISAWREYSQLVTA